MVAGDGERHQLLQRHAVLGIDVEELGTDSGEPQALANDDGGDEEARGDLLDPLALLDEALEGVELVERVQVDPLDILGEAVLLGADAVAAVANDARNGRGLGEALALHEQVEGAIAPTARRHLEHAGVLAVAVEDGPDAQRLEQTAPADVIGQLVNRDAGLHAPDIRLGQDEFVEGNVARGRQDEFLSRLGHLGSPRRAARRLSLDLQPVTKRSAALLLSFFSA